MWIDQRAYSDEDILKLLRQPELRLSFSQFGEDLFVWNHMAYRDGFYVDIGCHDPFRFSNTFLVHKFSGWKGINIDADPRAIARFEQYRPGDINLNVGVSDREGVCDFALFDEGAVGSFDPHMVESASSRFSLQETREVQLRPLANILDEYLPRGQYIDYMNVDCEGLDYQVLAGNDWRRYRPKLLSVEVHDLDLNAAATNSTIGFLAENGYQFVAQYFVTSFFRPVE